MSLSVLRGALHVGSEACVSRWFSGMCVHVSVCGVTALGLRGACTSWFWHCEPVLGSEGCAPVVGLRAWALFVSEGCVSVLMLAVFIPVGSEVCVCPCVESRGFRSCVEGSV